MRLKDVAARLRERLSFVDSWALRGYTVFQVSSKHMHIQAGSTESPIQVTVSPASPNTR